MTPHDRYLAYIHRKTDGVPMCASCRYYCQHYIYYEDLKRYIPMEDGHCIEPRIKARMPFDMCPRWEPRTERREA